MAVQVALLVSLIQGAIEIFKSKKAFKENLKTKSTVVALAPLPLAELGIQVADLNGDAAAVSYVISATLSLGLFLYRRSVA
jgi:hypothetical protein